MLKYILNSGLFERCFPRLHPTAVGMAKSPILHLQRQLSSSMDRCLFNEIAKEEPTNDRKVTVVGTGQVGMAATAALLQMNVTNQICLIDAFEEKAIGEMMDIQHASIYLKDPKITAGKDFSLSENSRVIIVPAGARQVKGETRLDLLKRNADIYNELIPKLLQHSPNPIFLLATNPVDVMTYIAWKISGLPINRVIGSGTNLDSMRFRFLIAERLKVAPSSVHAWIIGEHGDSSVPVWSSVNVAGVRLRDLCEDFGTEYDPDNWNLIHKNVVRAAYEVRKLKGYTSWAIGMSLSSITSAILNNTGKVFALTTSSKCQHGIEDDIMLSLPCVVNANGISKIVKQNLTTCELIKLQHSAEILSSAQSSVQM